MAPSSSAKSRSQRAFECFVWGVFNNLLLDKDYVSADGRENGLFNPIPKIYRFSVNQHGRLWRYGDHDQNSSSMPLGSRKAKSFFAVTDGPLSVVRELA